jgi:hypothetical protein
LVFATVAHIVLFRVDFALLLQSLLQPCQTKLASLVL